MLRGTPTTVSTGPLVERNRPPTELTGRSRKHRAAVHVGHTPSEQKERASAKPHGQAPTDRWWVPKRLDVGSAGSTVQKPTDKRLPSSKPHHRRREDVHVHVHALDVRDARVRTAHAVDVAALQGGNSTLADEQKRERTMRPGTHLVGGWWWWTAGRGVRERVSAEHRIKSRWQQSRGQRNRDRGTTSSAAPRRARFSSCSVIGETPTVSSDRPPAGDTNCGPPQAHIIPVTVVLVGQEECGDAGAVVDLARLVDAVGERVRQHPEVVLGREHVHHLSHRHLCLAVPASPPPNQTGYKSTARRTTCAQGRNCDGSLSRKNVSTPCSVRN